MVRKPSKVPMRLLVCAVVAGMCSAGYSDSHAGSLDLQRFHLSPDAHAFLALRDARLPPPGNIALNIGFNYAFNPLDSIDTSGNRAPVVRALLGVDVAASISALAWLEIAAVLPVVQWAKVDDRLWRGMGLDPKAFSMGNLRFEIGFRPLDPEAGPIGLQVTPSVVLPTGSSSTLTSINTVALGASVVASGVHGGLFWTLDVGYLHAFGEAITLKNLAGGSTLKLGAGVGYRVVPKRLNIALEALGAGIVDSRALATVQAKAFDSLHSSWELLLSTRVLMDEGFDAYIGGGPGLAPGYGSPDARIVIGFSAAPERQDGDGDGLDDDDDACPDEPEDLDAFEDGDGCPDPDNDGDGVLDAVDGSPDKAEDPDGFEDSDGVPDPDNDGDGVLDADDGAPDQPEDPDGFEDGDGVPDPDNDGDGLPDGDDGCPDEAETVNGFEDEDGCPESDGDGDGIVDGSDSCPDEAEVFNGVNDADGCPDESLAVIERTDGRLSGIQILERVYFATGRSAIKPASFPVLDAVVNILQGYPEIAFIEVQGHTDDQGRRSSNIALSQARADAVRDYLVSKAVAQGRLIPRGFGPDKPIADNASAEGRDSNRRVEFVVPGARGESDAPPNNDKPKPPTEP